MTAAPGVDAHERLPHRREVFQLLLGKIEAQRALRKNAAVLGDKVLPFFLEPGFERIPRIAHVGELGIAAFRWNDMGAERGVPGGNGLVTAVAVPELVADDGEQPLTVVARQDLVPGREVGYVRQ